MTRRTWFACLVVALAVGGAVAACSLNPQPIPPGIEGDDAGAGQGDAATQGGDKTNDDSGMTPGHVDDAGDSGSLTENPDAGDASDASDASLDGPDAAD